MDNGTTRLKLRPQGKPRNAVRQQAYSRRQEEILEKAMQLFAEHGYAGTDTQFLADQLHVGKGTLYRYFASKEELFLAAVDYGMRKYHEYLEENLKGITDPVEQIRHGIRSYLSFFAEHPECVELLIQERALFKDRKKPTFFQHRERNVERWRNLYRSLISRDMIRQMPAERITDVISDLLYGTMLANYFISRQPGFERQTSDILDVVLNGILSDSERQRRKTQEDELGLPAGLGNGRKDAK